MSTPSITTDPAAVDPTAVDPTDVDPTAAAWAELSLAAALVPELAVPLRALADQMGAVAAADQIARWQMPGDGGDLPFAFQALNAYMGTRQPGAELLADAHAANIRFIPGDQLPDTWELPGVWVYGDGPDSLLTTRAVAVLGSSSSSRYADGVAGDFGISLAEQGQVLCSDGGFGASSAALRGALVARGTTVTVLGRGLDVALREAGSMSRLYAAAAEDGLLVSAQPPGFAASTARRGLAGDMIARYARDVVVVEAAVGDPALAIAATSLSLEGHVWGVPGPINSRLSAGVNAAIARQQMVMLTAVTDLSL
ncbi:DNA-processing protein DprA [Gordonia phosphorivorans]|uniref:DNA-processing protein DprA n=1 Tax=Gordonia phosphorivorans TaxID=1056982 RepID=A0ABV6H457_9ACTN